MAKQKQATSVAPPKEVPGNCQSPDQPVDPSAALAAADAAIGGEITIVYGANDDEKAKFSGQTVAQARRAYTSLFNIPADAKTYINGNLVTNEEEAILRTGDQLDFLKEAGQKG